MLKNVEIMNMLKINAGGNAPQSYTKSSPQLIEDM